jgi:hypothetical protein
MMASLFVRLCSDGRASINIWNDTNATHVCVTNEQPAKRYRFARRNIADDFERTPDD